MLLEEGKISFGYGYFPESCVPPLFSGCTDVELHFYLMWAKTVWTSPLRIRVFPPDSWGEFGDTINTTVYGALNIGETMSDFGIYGVTEERLKYYDFTHVVEDGKVGIYYAKSIRTAKTESNAVFLRRALANFLPLDWRVWLCFAILMGVLYSLMTFYATLSRGKRFRTVLLILFQINNAMVVQKFYGANLSARTIAPPKQSRPFQTIEELAYYVKHKKYTLVFRDPSSDDIIYNKIATSTEQPLKFLADALKVNPPLPSSGSDPQALCSLVTGNNSLVLINNIRNVDPICDMTCLEKAHWLSEDLPSYWGAFILTKHLSVEFQNDATMMAERGLAEMRLVLNRIRMEVGAGACPPPPQDPISPAVKLALGLLFLLLTSHIISALYLGIEIAFHPGKRSVYVDELTLQNESVSNADQ